MADGSALDTSSLGNKVLKVTAIDSAGNITTKEVAYMVNSKDIDGDPGWHRRQRDRPDAAHDLGELRRVHAGRGPEYLANVATRDHLDSR